MNRKGFGKWSGIGCLVGIGICLVNLPGCARNSQLLSIAIEPTGGTFGAVDTSLFFQFKAFGTYTHPPRTVDITNQVNWQSDNPQVIQITSAGLASPNVNCGVAQVFAEMHNGDSDIISSSASITVNGPASLGCTPAGAPPVLSVQVATATNSTNGNVTSSPGGINCSIGSTCSAAFTAGTVVTLTATPAANFKAWTSGCSQTSGSACTVFLQSNTTVVATFN